VGVDPRARIARLLRERDPGRVPKARTERSAAVALVLRPPAGGTHGGVATGDGSAGGPGGAASRGGRDGAERIVRPLPAGASGPLARDFSALEALFVLRAERDGDPWSGHVGLPGGHREPGDADLAAAARREVREETGLALPSAALLGRLDEIHPRSRRLPSVAVTPFVAWLPGPREVRAGEEVDDHFWAPLGALEEPGRRSVLTFRRGDVYRAFPTVEFGDYTIWGLTLAIARRFLSLLPRAPEADDPGPDDEDPGAGEAGEPDGGAPGARTGQPRGKRWPTR